MQNISYNGKVCLVPITSDRGLCGAINSGIVREIKYKINHAPNRSNFSIISIGEKGSGALLRPFPDLMKMSISDVNTPLNYSTVSAIAQKISSNSNNSDKIVIYFNEFKCAIKTVI